MRLARLLPKSPLFIYLLLIGPPFLSGAQQSDKIPYRSKGKWGFADKNFSLVISPAYDSVGLFKLNSKRLNVAKVKQGKEYFYIDSLGNVADYVTGDKVKDANIFVYTLIDEQLNKFKREIDEELYFFKVNGKYGFKSDGSDTILTARFLDFGSYDKGMNSFKDRHKKGLVTLKDEHGWRLYDSLGRPLSQYYDSISSPVSNGYIVLKDGKFGVISRQGTQVLSLKYEKLEQRYVFTKCFVFKRKNKFGLIDEGGKVLLPSRYIGFATATIPHIGCFRFQEKDGQYVYVNYDGKIFSD